MDKMPILLAVAMMTIAAAIYNVGESFSDWKSPGEASDQAGYNFAYYLSERLSAEGVLNSSQDLNDPLLKFRKIVLSHSLNETTTKDVIRKLLYLDSLDHMTPIDLYISTSGGWYDSAFTIIDTINSIQAPVNTICVGGCYSAGLLVMTSGTGSRVSYSHAHFSAHISYGNESDDRAYASQPDRVNTYLKSNTNLPKNWFPLDDDRNYYFTPEQAVEFGIIDKIESSPNKPRKRNAEYNPIMHTPLASHQD